MARLGSNFRRHPRLQLPVVALQGDALYRGFANLAQDNRISGTGYHPGLGPSASFGMLFEPNKPLYAV